MYGTTSKVIPPEIVVNVHILMSITAIWQPQDVKITAMNTAIMN